MNLGMKRITTHKDSGGTGIGLSSTYGLCKKYNASFVITEDINSENTTFKDTNSKDLISEKSSSNVITFTKKFPLYLMINQNIVSKQITIFIIYKSLQNVSI